MVEKAKDSEYYRYTVGGGSTFREAIRLRNELVNAGFDGAFIVAYIDGVRADRAMLKKNRSKYPDLSKFLRN